MESAFNGLSAVCRHYEQEGFSGGLRFSFSEKNGIRNIDLCEDSTAVPGRVADMADLPAVCNKMSFGWITVYFSSGQTLGFDYKLNLQGISYKRLEAECLRGCRRVKIAVKKSGI